MTRAYFDTSAVIPLFLEEPNTRLAQATLGRFTPVYSWSWMRVEAEAGLSRRRAGREVWREWRQWMQAVGWLDLEARELDRVCTFNRGLSMRAADAAHLYVFDQASRVMPDLQLVTFDREMTEVAQRLGMAVWRQVGPG